MSVPQVQAGEGSSEGGGGDGIQECSVFRGPAGRKIWGAAWIISTAFKMMSESKPYNPLDHSIVQAIFKSDACHEYQCPDYVTALIIYLHNRLDTAYWNVNQSMFDDSDWQFLEIPGLEYRRYYWGDCDCGEDYPAHSKDCNGLTCTCGAEAQWKPRGFHLPTCSLTLPNFKFGEVKINWYKSIGRGMSTNIDWSEAEWRKWFDACLLAIQQYNNRRAR